MLEKLFKLKKECRHENVSIDSDFSYCPDCGELIENCWYITRCACCGVKLKAFVNKKGEISTQENFCKNCGSKGFIIERLKKLNFVDIQYAVLVKTIITKEQMNFTQSWVNTENDSFRLELLK